MVTKRLAPSPFESVMVHGRRIHIKRDDLLNPYFSGNKARKFSYFLEHDFPLVDTIVGYGSVQANSLYSLAALAKLKHWQLDFYVHRIPHWLKQKPTGNYLGALELGANIIEVNDLETNLDDWMQSLRALLPESSLFIPEGGRCEFAQHGIKKLAQEIAEYCQQQGLNAPLIMLPSGTGTTAVYLQTFLKHQVVTCACVGAASYLKSQFSQLQPDQTKWPQILMAKKKYHFGKLYREFYDIWNDLNQQTGIEFDLLYDPLGWLTLIANFNRIKEHRDIIYIHQGGILGNKSMLPRYRRKYPDVSE